MLDHLVELIEKSPCCQATGHPRQKVQSTLCISHPGRVHKVPAVTPGLDGAPFPTGVLLLPLKQASISGHPVLPYGCILCSFKFNLFILLPFAFKKEKKKREFPVGPVVRTPSFHCQGPGSIPGPGTKIPQAAWRGQKQTQKSQMTLKGFNIFKMVKIS